MSTEHAKRIRTVYKARGWSSRDISVRCSDGCAIDIKINSPKVHKAVAERIANAFEHIRRDDYSGEILSGGNLFISVNQSAECLAALAEPYLPAFRAALALAIERVGTNEMTPIEGAPGMLLFGDRVWQMEVCPDDGPRIWLDSRYEGSIIQACGLMAEQLRPAYEGPGYCREEQNAGVL